MTNPNPLLKYVMKTQTPEVLHSSGYAKAQNSSSFGTASTETFADRRRIEEQRKFVRGYRNSRLAGGITGLPRPKAYTSASSLPYQKAYTSAPTSGSPHQKAPTFGAAPAPNRAPASPPSRIPSQISRP